jgi:hypothetical protein
MTRFLLTGSWIVCLVLPLVSGCSRSGESSAAERPAVAVEVSRVAPGDLQETIAVVGTLPMVKRSVWHSAGYVVIRRHTEVISMIDDASPEDTSVLEPLARAVPPTQAIQLLR